MDLTATLAAITAASGDVTTIGLAVFGVLVTVATFRWIRRALG